MVMDVRLTLPRGIYHELRRKKVKGRPACIGHELSRVVRVLKLPKKRHVDFPMLNDDER